MASWDERGALQILDDMQRKLDAAMGAEVDIMKAVFQCPILFPTEYEISLARLLYLSFFLLGAVMSCINQSHPSGYRLTATGEDHVTTVTTRLTDDQLSLMV